MGELTNYFHLDEDDLNKKDIVLNKNDEQFDELHIKSFSQFNDIISAIYDGAERGENYHTTFYFRGVKDKKYNLESSVQFYRAEEREADLINGLYSAAPKEFLACKSDFEMVALMQHYGLPTRFLDFTSNPFVALWFACADYKHSNTEGAVYIADSRNRVTKQFINIIVKLCLAENYGVYSNPISKIISFEEMIYFFKEIYKNSERLFFINAPASSQREINQEGMFLVGLNRIDGAPENIGEIVSLRKNYGLIRVLKDKYEGNGIFFEKLGCYDKKLSKPYIIKVIIPSESKREIIYELERRGINKSFIFPTLENIAEQVKRRNCWLGVSIIDGGY